MRESEHEEPPAVLAIRALRDGTFHVTYQGIALPVDAVDVDDYTIEKLKGQILTRVGYGD